MTSSDLERRDARVKFFRLDLCDYAHTVWTNSARYIAHVGRGVFQRGQPSPHPKMAGPQHPQFLEPPTYAHTVWLDRCCGIVEFNVTLDTVYRSFRRRGPWAVMCISHSVMEGQRHKKPKRDGFSCLHAIVEAAKYLGGSFKLVTLVPKTVREMTQLPREI